MVKRLIAILSLFFLVLDGFAQDLGDSSDVYRKLDYVMENQDLYIKKREDRIVQLKQEANLVQKDARLYLQKNYEIFKNYKKFQSDSALRYITFCKQLALSEPDSVRIVIHLDLAWIYSTIGRYIEASDLLKQLKPTALPRTLLPKYYDTYSAFYSHYGQSNNHQEYYQASERYRDSLLLVLDPTSAEYKNTFAIKTLFKGQREEAKKLFEAMWAENREDKEQTALIAYFIGLIYKQEKNILAQRYYFARSGIADIEIANRDNASLQDLALTYYELRDFDHAFKFIEKAIDDAMGCNVRYRIVEGTSFYPIINAAYQKKINTQNKQLQVMLVVISFLSLVLIMGLVIIFRQVQRLRKIREELSITNSNLRKLNEEINYKNTQLSESNHIKEEYIAQFFDLCSNYIDKMEDIRKALLKKASNQQWDAIKEQLKSTQMVEREVQQLYINFDRIFLNLYPSFVSDFNELLLSDEQILPKKGEFLNTELRIFALIRLGIIDSVKIASFLRYSLRTVYNYRTKVRNKAIGNRDDFEDRVRQIAVIDRS
ncbi:DUF6377 domain-containing protein [Sphingobacterium sp. SRCM116780]|uniref:DUF6377 domain-containing protein n=1 Tax=Sphingobacterium sp. SRCM116780 TaxID=2907623 RepID=UPI001F1A1352|nr:DUF6377 domain-containing protein [Sphingobacterium sp. SRCM116780]UIR56032.1 DUF6377 domain-containing protein [Sphingobacterium sp. SRCM116780]